MGGGTDGVATGRHLGQAWFFCIMMSWGIFAETYTFFVSKKIYGNDDDDDDRSVTLTTYWAICYALAQFVGTPILGALSDVAGRRPILMVGVAVDILGFPVIAAFPNPTVFLGCGLVMGLLDATSAIVKATIVDFVTETVARGEFDAIAGGDADYALARLSYSFFRGGDGPPEKTLTREALTSEYALLNAYAVLGMVVGVALGELLYDEVGLRLAMACSGLLLLPVAGLLLARFPETRHGDASEADAAAPSFRRSGSQSEAEHDPLKGLRRSVGLFFRTPRIAKLAAGTFALAVGIYGCQSIVLYYGEDVFGLGSVDIMIVLFEATLIAPACSYVAVRVFVPAYGAADTFAGLGLVSLAGSVFIGLVTTPALFFAGVPFFFVGYAVLPIAFGPMANEIPYHDQGRFQGAIYGLCTVASLVGYYVFLVLYQHTYDSAVPGAVFLAVACVNAVAIAFYHAAGNAPPGTGALAETTPAEAPDDPKRPLLPAEGGAAAAEGAAAGEGAA